MVPSNNLHNISFFDIFMGCLTVYLVTYYFNLLKNLILCQAVKEDYSENDKNGSNTKTFYKGRNFFQKKLLKGLNRKKSVRFNENQNTIYKYSY